MSHTNQTSRRTVWGRWVLSGLLIVGSLWLWMERQYVVDAIQVRQYKPTADIQKIVTQTGMTDGARFTFYATRPSIESSGTFNQHCERREADSPILGCYAANRIYIFDVSDERLEGVKMVTAAHEMLHAEYDRLSEAERTRIDGLLKSAYERVTNPDLEARMDYYSKNQPGQNINELHSILGTEFSNLGEELETYYQRYFKDRQTLVDEHARVDKVFDDLSEQADGLVDRIERLAYTINVSSERYNDNVSELNQSVERFNQRANQNGGFTTEEEFEAARRGLVQRSEALGSDRQAIQRDVNTYKTLLAQLDSINAESSDLNRSLDSTLSDVPEI